MGNSKGNGWTSVAFVGLMVSVLFLPLAALPAGAHAADNAGDQRQLYSYYTTNPPTINGAVAAAGNPSEWRDAYVREINMVRAAGGNFKAWLLLMNDDANLYIGLIYPWGNNGNPNSVTLYFDEGNNRGGASDDGSHDDALTNPNENAIYSDRDQATSQRDRYWDGNGWANDPDAGFDGQIVDGYYTNRFNWEVQVPLDDAKADGAGTGSDLDVTSTDEIGFQLKITTNGGANAGDYYWEQTNQNDNDPGAGAGWADIRLGKQLPDRSTYAIWARYGNPTVDGDIDNDPNWFNNAWTRDIILSNFAGQTKKARVYINQDPTGNDIYIGAQVWTNDGTKDNTDEMRLYFKKPDGTNNFEYTLTNNNENAFSVNTLNSDSDFFCLIGGGEATWTNDNTVGDPRDTIARSGYYDTVAGLADNHYDYEFAIDYTSGLYDLNLPGDDGKLQFLLRYYDKTTDTNFWWDQASNADHIWADDTSNINVALGWARLYLGAPWAVVNRPLENGKVTGDAYPVKTQARSSAGGGNIAWARFKVEGYGWIALMNTGGDNWENEWDTTVYPDGQVNMFFEWRDLVTGVTLRKIVPVNIRNQAPTVKITAPANGATVSGNLSVTATVGGSPNQVDLYVDGNLYAAMENTGVIEAGGTRYSKVIPAMALSDGIHAISVIAQDAQGRRGSDAVTATFANFPSLTIVRPLAGALIGAAAPYNLTAAANDSDGIALAQFRLDGSNWTQMKAAGGQFYYLWNLTNATADGLHTFDFRAVDGIGVATQTSVKVTTDGTPPAGSVAVPGQDGTYVIGKVVFQARGSDASGVASAVLAVDGTNYTMGYNAASGYWEYSLDSVRLGLADGGHTAEVVLVDGAGNPSAAGTIQRTFNLDNSDPVLDIAAPQAGAHLSGEVDLNLTGTSDLFLSGLAFSVDGGPWTAISAVTLSARWNTTTLADGQHTLTLRATDRAGRVTTRSITVVVDNHAPEVTPTAPPAPLLFVSGTVTFRAVARDGVGVGSVSLTLSGGWGSNTSVRMVEMVAVSGGEYGASVDTTGMYDGNYTATITASDSVWATTAVFPVNIDNAPPALDLAAPLDGAVLKGVAPLRVAAADIFLVSAEYNVDSTGWAPLAGGTGTLNTASLADGPHTLAFRASDGAGHVTERRLTVLTDNTPPKVDAVFPSIEGQFVGGKVTFRAAASDSVGVASVEINMERVVTAPMGYNTTSGFYEFLLDTTTKVGDGTYNLTMTARDRAGQASTASRTVAVDNSPAGLTITFPSNGAALKGTVTIAYTADDRAFPASGYAVEYSVDGNGWAAAKEPLDTTKLEDGAHTLTLRVTDGAGHQTADTLTFYSGNGAPVVTVLSPASGASVARVFALTVSAADRAGIRSVVAVMGGTTANMSRNSATGFFEANIDSRALKSGESFTMKVTVTNAAGVVKEVTMPLTVDNDAPSVGVKYRTDANSYGARPGRLTFAAIASDTTGVARVYIRIDGKEWREMIWVMNPDPSRSAIVGYQYNWDTGVKDNGEHIVEFRSVDVLGNEATQRILVTVANFDYGMVVGAILLVLVLGGAMFLWMRWKRASKREADTTATAETGPSTTGVVETGNISSLESGPGSEVSLTQPGSAPEYTPPAPPAPAPEPPAPAPQPASEQPPAAGQAAGLIVKASDAERVAEETAQAPPPPAPAEKKEDALNLDDLVASLDDRTASSERKPDDTEQR